MIKNNPINSIINFTLVAFFCTCFFSQKLYAGESVKEIHLYRGQAPTVDGNISKAEYADAVRFESFGNWNSSFTPVVDKEEFSIIGWAKHDGQNLYFAFDITDDILYGIHTDRWLPDENPVVHEFSPRGFPWFGDCVELFINASNRWENRGADHTWEEGKAWADVQFNAGSGESFQMVCNMSKSIFGGIGTGGLMTGEQRINRSDYSTYMDWIMKGQMKAVVKVKDDKSGYTVEWMIRGNPCLEVKPGVFWNAELGLTKMGFNIAAQDLDERESGDGNWGNFHHEEWWAGTNLSYYVNNWGTLYLHPGNKPTEIYVALDGKDDNDGSIEKPFATIKKAQSKVRQLTKIGLDRDVRVILREGTYYLKQPLEFNSTDAGDDQHTVTYQAYPAFEWPGEKVTISGGKVLSGWQENDNNTWKVKLNNVESGDWWFRDLYRNGQQLSRARFPNNGFLKVKEVSDNYKKIGLTESFVGFNPLDSNTELITLLDWSMCRGIISSVDENKKVITETPMAWVGHRWCSTKPGLPAFLENHTAFIDTVDEWALDEEGWLTLETAADDNPNQQDIIAPVLEKLITIQGKENDPVQNLHFYGIAFAHTNWQLPEFGYREIQAGYYGTVTSVEPVFSLGAAIEMQYANECQFELCSISHTGASGIGLGAGCSNIIISGCKIVDIGGNGIHVGHRTGNFNEDGFPLDSDWNEKNQVPKSNLIKNNHVAKTGQEQFGGVGIFAAYTDKTIIAYNRVEDLPYSGISIGFKWNDDPTSQKNTLVEYNYILNVMKILADGGGVYTLGFQPNALVRGNLIHDVQRSKTAHGSANNGFFLDQGSKGFTFENNIVYQTAGKPVRLNKNDESWNTWKGNFLGVPPTDIHFPWNAAAQAGIEASYLKKVMSIK